MITEILKINPKSPEQSRIEIAAQVLRKGGTVAFPTETVYGLGADALDPKAVAKIFMAKGRPSDNPLIVHISDIRQVDRLVKNIPERAIKLMELFWPGPLTIVFKKADIIPDIISAGLDTVAIRFPSHPVAQALIQAAGIPIAAPSANTSGKPSPTVAQHVINDLLGKIDMIIEGGPARVGLESTVVDLTEETPALLRPGGVTYEQLKKIMPDICIDPVVLDKLENGKAPRAPGMKYTHYSPEAEVVVVEGSGEKVTDMIHSLVEENRAKGLKVGVLTDDENMGAYHADCVLSAGKAQHPETIAANLFYKLREFDEEKVDIVFAQSVSERGIGLAIRNRLNKAAGYKIIRV